jgi:predicted rRNA methylase YqxC with S4 and FtsJ domains
LERVAVTPSAIAGAGGNQEYFLLLERRHTT